MPFITELNPEYGARQKYSRNSAKDFWLWLKDQENVFKYQNYFTLKPENLQHSLYRKPTKRRDVVPYTHIVDLQTFFTERNVNFLLWPAWEITCWAGIFFSFWIPQQYLSTWTSFFHIKNNLYISGTSKLLLKYSQGEEHKENITDKNITLLMHFNLHKWNVKAHTITFTVTSASRIAHNEDLYCWLEGRRGLCSVKANLSTKNKTDRG